MSQLSQHNQFLELLVQQQQGWDGSRNLPVPSGNEITPPLDEDSNSAAPTDPSSDGVKKPQSPSRGAFRIRATRYGTYCNEWCGCNCHKPQALRTPMAARKFLGFLFIGYTGLPYLAQQCSERGCRKQAVPSLKVTYYFPTWFLHRTLQFVFSGPLAEGPQIFLRVPRVIPDISEVFLHACQGNLPKMRLLFAQGIASPFDVGSTTGRTPLHVSTLMFTIEPSGLLTLMACFDSMLLTTTTRRWPGS